MPSLFGLLVGPRKASQKGTPFERPLISSSHHLKAFLYSSPLLLSSPQADPTPSSPVEAAQVPSFATNRSLIHSPIAGCVHSSSVHLISSHRRTIADPLDCSLAPTRPSERCSLPLSPPFFSPSTSLRPTRSLDLETMLTSRAWASQTGRCLLLPTGRSRSDRRPSMLALVRSQSAVVGLELLDLLCVLFSSRILVPVLADPSRPPLSVSRFTGWRRSKHRHRSCCHRWRRHPWRRRRGRSEFAFFHHIVRSCPDPIHFLFDLGPNRESTSGSVLSPSVEEATSPNSSLPCKEAR